MSGGRAERERGLFDELRSALRGALQGMTGHAPEVSFDPLPAAPGDAALRWRQPLGSLPGAVWVLAAEADWKALGRAVLQAAGVEGSDDAELKSTYIEIVNQALAGLAQALTSRLEREVVCSGGAFSEMGAVEPPGSPALEARWAEFDVRMGAVSFALIVGMEDALLDVIEGALAPTELAGSPAGSAPLQTSAPALAAASEAPPLGDAPAEGDPAAESARGGSKTFDLLLEVELPVSVSFGRAQILLRDVLKLSTGSIVELNRSIVEPVEIIVNNCVIARGEVVVVEGNFGVRIQEVVSRQERLRTLQ